VSARKKVKEIGDPTPEEPQPIANIEMERALLGCLIMSNAVFERVDGILKPEDFFEPVNGRIYETVATLMEQQRPASPITLTPYLQGNVDLGEMTVPQYLVRLAAEATTGMNAADFAKELKRFAQRRQLIELAKHMLSLAPDIRPDQDVNAIVDSFTGMMEEIKSSSIEGGTSISMKDALDKSLERIASAFEKGETIAGMSTGLEDLDTAIGGLAPANSIVLSARPGMGKTAMAMGWMKKVAERHPDKMVLFFSQEMSAEDVATRAIADATGMSVSKLRSADVTQDEIANLAEYVRSLGEALKAVEIEQMPSVKLSFIRARCKALSRKRPLAMIVIDYLQLMTGPGNVKGRGGSRVEELSAITAGLKALAKEYDVPVVILSQLSRKCEDRDDKRPQLADLRESGSIEQDADVVIALYREEYYLAQTKPKDGDHEGWERWSAAMKRYKGIAEILVLKNRHGATEPVEVGWSGQTTSFRNLTEDEKNREPDEKDKPPVYINKGFQDVYRAIQKTLSSVGVMGQRGDVPLDRAVATTTECFNTLVSMQPVMEGDDLETIKAQLKKPFPDAVKWLIREGVIEYRKQPSEEVGVVFLTGRKVRT
jgi:replicative DNA helicase